MNYDEPDQNPFYILSHISLLAVFSHSTLCLGLNRLHPLLSYQFTGGRKPTEGVLVDEANNQRRDRAGTVVKSVHPTGGAILKGNLGPPLGDQDFPDGLQSFIPGPSSRIKENFP